MAHNLIVSYAPRRHIEITRPFPAVPKEIRKFHSNELVEFLSLVSPELLADPELGMQFERLHVGDVYCFFLGYSDFCQAASGGSVDAADIALNWVTSLQ